MDRIPYHTMDDKSLVAIEVSLSAYSFTGELAKNKSKYFSRDPRKKALVEGCQRSNVCHILSPYAIVERGGDPDPWLAMADANTVSYEPTNDLEYQVLRSPGTGGLYSPSPNPPPHESSRFSCCTLLSRSGCPSGAQTTHLVVACGTSIPSLAIRTDSCSTSASQMNSAKRTCLCTEIRYGTYSTRASCSSMDEHRQCLHSFTFTWIIFCIGFGTCYFYLNLVMCTFKCGTRVVLWTYVRL